MRSQNESDLTIYCDLLKGRIPYDSKVRLCSHVLQSSINDLKHHKAMLEAMGLGADAKNNIHIGGAYGDKVTSSQRFVEQVDALELSLRERMTLENDDKTFNAVETLEACKRTGLR
ncbi:UNVERIFIED_CONTAM: UV DNA damage repair endonuclease [Paenibacillus sp. PvR008]